MSRPRQMRLTAGHLEPLKRDIPDPGPQLIEGFRPATEADYEATEQAIFAARPPGPFWLFGISSLIWRPETAFEEKRVALARGWHRRFCLGWDYRFRGSREEPGLMMALDRGGQCRGVVYRLPEETLADEMHRLVRREMSMVPTAFPWRFIRVETPEGRVSALTFPVDRNSPRYIAGLSDDELAEVLSTARGFRGSMAEYVFSTVSMLESIGIHDRKLWAIQERIAKLLEARHPGLGG